MSKRLVSRIRADRILAGLKQKINGIKAVDLFEDPSVQPHHAHEALSVLRESKTVTPQFYEKYLLYFAGLGHVDKVTEGLKLAGQDEIKVDGNQIVIYALSRAGEVEKAFQLLHKEVARGAPPTLARAYGNVINRLARMGRNTEALEALSWSHSFSIPNIKSYHALLAYYNKKRDVASAFRLYGQLKSRKLTPDEVVFSELLHLLSHDDPRVAMLFEDMRLYGIPPNVITHNIVMASEGRAGDVNAVRARFATMSAQQLLPTIASYHALLHAYKTRRDPAGALVVLDEMRTEGLPPDSYAYVLVAEAMALAGDLLGPQQLLARMDAERVDVTQHFLACIMDAQGNQPDWVCEEMSRRGVAQDTNTLETQLRMLVEKNTKRALQIYHEMRSKQQLPSEKTVTLLIHELRRNNRVRECKEILLDLDNSGMKLPVKMYNIVLGMLGKTKDLESCSTILAIMKNKGPTPDELTYQSLALGFGYAGLGHLALQTLRAAKAAGFEARTVYGAVVKALGATGWQEEMVSVVEEMCKEGIATPKTFADAIRNNFRKMALCKHLFELMKTHNIRRDATVYNLLVRMAKINNDHALAFDLTAQMRAEGIAFDAATYEELVQIAARHNDFDTCAQLIERMWCEGAECTPHAGIYSHIIIELLRAERVDHARAQYFFDDMLAHGLAPTTDDVLHWMVKVYCASGAFTQAWDVYERARKAMKGVMFINTHNTLLTECMWRGDVARCDAMLDAAGTLDTQLREVDFVKVFTNAGDRRGCDELATARVFSRMHGLGVTPQTRTRKLVARIYAQNADEEGREKEGAEEEEKVEARTREILERDPDIQTKSTQERMKMRLDLETDMDFGTGTKERESETESGIKEGESETGERERELNEGGKNIETTEIPTSEKTIPTTGEKTRVRRVKTRLRVGGKTRPKIPQKAEKAKESE
eukprot:Phypoly_transcript_02227.p1 GENE.Phypoly_transcript_02227~~Phypoly_transcript_02227.p1  ORF type:complete len:936 (-),score=250.69 Phypoly_transcript_02227:65-2872(-)